MMTDQPTNAANDSARLEAELEDAEQMHGNLSRAMRMQFASAWQNDPEVANLPVEVFLSGEPGIVIIEPDEDNVAASGSVRLDVSLQVNDARDMVVRTSEGEQISYAEAASRLGLDADVATAVISKAGSLVRDDAAQHRTLDELQGRAEQALDALEANGRVTTHDELLDPEPAARAAFLREWNSQRGQEGAVSIAAEEYDSAIATSVPSITLTTSTPSGGVVVQEDGVLRSPSGQSFEPIGEEEAALRLGVNPEEFAAAVEAAMRGLHAAQPYGYATELDALGREDRERRAAGPSEVSPEYDAISASFWQARDERHNLHRAMSQQFFDAWRDTASASLSATGVHLGDAPGMVTISSLDRDAGIYRGVRVEVDLSTEREGQATLSTWDEETISVSEAANRLGWTVQETQRTVDDAVSIVRAEVSQHRSLKDMSDNVSAIGRQLESTEEAAEMRQQYDEEMRRDAAAGLDPAEARDLAEELDASSADADEDLDAAPEWASDPVDQPYTPERVSADWIQATATVSAYLASDRKDLARNLIDEIDTNLRDFASGGYPPGSDELAGIYTDAIYRAAIPYGPSPISAEEVARQLNGIGLTVPTIDLDTIASRTGVTPLSPQHTVTRIDGDFAAAWDEGVGSNYSQPVSHGPVVDYGFGTPSVTVSIGDARDWDSTFRLSLERDGSAALTVSGDDPVDIATIAETTGLPEQEIQAITTGATTALRSTLPTPEVEPEPALDPALVDVAAARMNVRRAIASISENSEAAQDYLMTANKRLNVVVELLRPDQAREDVLAVQESVQQATEKVAAVAETATKVDTEVTLYTTPECVGCAATKRTLDKAGVEYEEVPLQEHPDLVQQFKRQGLAQAPIVETKDGERWSGFNPKKLREHGLDHRSRQQRQGGAGTDQGYER